MIDFGANTMATNIRVQGKCKVESRRVLRHSLQFAFRSEHEYFRSK